MPELPEVETIVRQLNTVLPGKTIADIQVRREKSLPGESWKSLIGQTISGVTRKQKIIVVEFHAGTEVLLMHLKMTGQLIYMAQGDGTTRRRVVGGHPTTDWMSELPSKHTRVIIQFTDGSTLYFNDQRVFGWMRIQALGAWREARATMAPDVVEEAFTVKYLVSVLKRSRRPVKLVILDQDKIGGMGNIYANDALYAAKIHPLTPANEIQPEAVKRLHQAMVAVINKGIELGGSSISHFMDTAGVGGRYQDHFLVYNKAGERCAICGNIIEKCTIGGRGSYFCPHCQVKC